MKRRELKLIVSAVTRGWKDLVSKMQSETSAAIVAVAKAADDRINVTSQALSKFEADARERFDAISLQISGAQKSYVSLSDACEKSLRSLATISDQAAAIKEISDRVDAIKIPNGISDAERKEIVDILLTKCDEICSHATASINESLAEAAKSIPVPKAPTVEELTPSIIKAVSDMQATLELAMERRLSAFDLKAQKALSAAIELVTKEAQAKLSTFTQPKDGIDGLPAKNMRVAMDAVERTIEFIGDLGDGSEKSFGVHKFCYPVYVGAYDSKRKYEEAQIVTRNGSAWIANEDDPQGLPGYSEDWTCFAARGLTGRAREPKSDEPKQVRVAPRKES